MARPKTEPFVWRESAGVLHQWMLREYIRWLFPQLGRSYEPPMGVRDFTTAAQSRNAGKQPQPFRPRAAAGPVLRQDLQAFADYALEALRPYSDRSPWHPRRGITLCFVPDLRDLHRHLIQLIAKKRLAQTSS